MLAEHGTVGLGPLLVDGKAPGASPRNRIGRENRVFARQGWFALTGSTS